MSKYYIIRGGKKKLVNSKIPPNGYYLTKKGEDHATLVDPDYPGFKMVWEHIPSTSSGRPSHGVITDSIDLTGLHDGKNYSSKSKYYQSLRDSGNHIVESGEFTNKKREIQGDYNLKKDLKQAIQQHLGS